MASSHLGQLFQNFRGGPVVPPVGAPAMLGRFEEARAILGEERASPAERGRGIVLAGALGFDSVELQAGDHARDAACSRSREADTVKAGLTGSRPGYLIQSGRSLGMARGGEESCRGPSRQTVVFCFS